mmetsp:Transcript_66654/g.134357  ORF Transcript_66654/g.134357 Transcript_66654/m.134357 type:complete len:343 (-) Transcript_66654:254-1282(-)
MDFQTRTAAFTLPELHGSRRMTPRCAELSKLPTSMNHRIPQIDDRGLKFSRGFRRNAYLSTSVALAILLLRNSRIQRLQSQAVSALLVSVGGLLSGSCCLLQLVLNYFAVGCAGFAALDKARPFFLTLTFGGLAGRAGIERKAGVSSPRPVSWAIALTLAFLPEILRLANKRGDLRGGPSDGEEGAFETTFTAQVAGVKCEACATGLKDALQIAADEAAEAAKHLNPQTGSVVTKIAVSRESVERTLVTIKATTPACSTTTMDKTGRGFNGRSTAHLEALPVKNPAYWEGAGEVPSTPAQYSVPDSGVLTAASVLDAACRKRSYTYSDTTSATRPTSLPRRI